MQKQWKILKFLLLLDLIFKKQGIRHYDLYFTDGTCPSEEIIRKFLSIIETETGAVAVHCRAGLGRAGTLIACYAMKHFEFPAAEIIAWTRMCRPGSILGPQQMFLIEIEDTCFKWGEAFKQNNTGSSIFGGGSLEDKIPFRRKSFDGRGRERYSAVDKAKGQAKALLSVKAKNQSITHYSIDDRDAISPPISYRRKKTFLIENSQMNLTQTIFLKDLISIRLVSPTKKTAISASL